MTESQVIEFVSLSEYPDYEILSQYPFTIRRKDNHFVITEGNFRNNGYICICLNQKTYYKHVVIAKQFIPNPNNLSDVDHINRDKGDYHIENLRWVSRSENCKNKNSTNHKVIYEFIDDIPDDAIMVDFYNVKTERREFNVNEYFYYYNNDTKEDTFYRKITNNVYKILHINKCKCGLKCVNLKDKNNKTTSLTINRFKRQHDIPILE